VLFLWNKNSKKPERIIKNYTFETFFGITYSKSGMGDEEGIRCETGAVPAAVCLE